MIAVNGSKVSDTAQKLLHEQLPKLAVIKDLRATLTEHERLLYEYYATSNREQIWPRVISHDQQLQELMVTAHQAFSGHIMALPNIYADVKFYRQALDSNLSNTPAEWDKARHNLAQLTLSGEKAEEILSTLTQEVQDSAWQGAERTQQQVSRILIFIICFTILIVLAALYISYLTQANLKRTAQRRALAKFPERNPNPVMNLNWHGQVLYANPACHELLSRLSLTQEGVEALLPENFYRNLKLWQRKRYQQEKFDADINGRNLSYNLSLLRDLGSCHLYIEDITEQKQAAQQLHFQAYHDVHTSLPNRRQFELDIAQITEQKLPISIMFINIDRFKHITASQGYFIGDQIIKSLGNRLTYVCDDLDFSVLCYRLDGSTFCIVVNSQQSKHAWATARSLQSAMDEPLVVNEHRYYLTLSMGFCHFPEDGRDVKTLVTNGHAALNHAKLRGDTAEQYSQSLHGQSQSWLPIETGIRKALENDLFVLHYQAKVDAKHYEIKSCEALIRWQDEEGFFISPGKFIPIAEQTGLIIKIGQWVLEQGFKQARLFSDSGKKVSVAINISARQFQDRHFIRHIKITLADSMVDPRLIELEITESLLLDNAEQSIHIMKQLKSMGFSIAIDDFGTGYSSLSYLKQLPVDTLKVDQMFVRNLESSRDDQSIIKTIVSLGKDLGLKIVAEGVETQGQLQFLQSLECDYIQGFLFSRPGLPDDLFK